jgi:hypothetical protein
MNPNNYGTREACQRLVKAGIVLETEVVWCGHRLQYEWEGTDKEVIPAPSMAEVWRALPFQSYIKQMGDLSLAWICDDDDETKTLESGFIQNVNPTDALIYLLIWLTAQKEGVNET